MSFGEGAAVDRDLQDTWATSDSEHIGVQFDRGRPTLEPLP